MVPEGRNTAASLPSRRQRAPAARWSWGRPPFARRRPPPPPWPCACRRGPCRCVAGKVNQSVRSHAYTSVSDAAIEACRARQGKAPNRSPPRHGRWRSFSAAGFRDPDLGRWQGKASRTRRTAMVASRMYDWLIVILVSLAGYVEAPAWFILLGAFGLTIEGWWGKLGLLRHSPRAVSTQKDGLFRGRGHRQPRTCGTRLSAGPNSARSGA